MTAQPASTAPAAPTSSSESGGGGFSLPSAYTILFALIVLMAIATYIIPAGRYELDEDGQPIPGSYAQVEQNPQRIITDSLLAPINGLYGIESAEDGSISVWNSGELFGAIDVALFILVIGGFLGVTMKTGAIQGGIAQIVSSLRGRERLLIPILMIVFAIGGTTFGMAEESLAFYALVITVMVAAGYDALVGASILLLGCGIGVLGSTINPFATGIASGFAGTSIDEGIERQALLRHAEGRAADREHDHQDRDEKSLAAPQARHDLRDSGLDRARLHRHAEEAADDEDEECHVDGAEQLAAVPDADAPVLGALDAVEAVDRRQQRVGDDPLRILVDLRVRPRDGLSILIELVATGGNDVRRDRHQHDQREQDRVGRWQGESAALLTGARR